MRKLKVYYNPSANYDDRKNTNANIWISIDEMHLVDPITANRELIRGEVQTALLQKQRYDPVGIFSPTGASYMIEEPGGRRHMHAYGEVNIPPINYGTILPGDLQTRLLGRLASIRDDLRDPDIEIECIQGVPPT